MIHIYIYKHCFIKAFKNTKLYMCVQYLNKIDSKHKNQVIFFLDYKEMKILFLCIAKRKR